MRRSHSWTAILLLAAGCSPSPRDSSRPDLSPASVSPPVALEEAGLVAGGTVYVPIYTHVYQNLRRRPFRLVVTLSIRNTDRETPIRILHVLYHGADGRLIRDYLDLPMGLPPLASTDFVLQEQDRRGTGTSFIVEWAAEKEVQEPVIEAVMISTALSQGLSFTTQGRVIRKLRKPE